MLVEGEPGPRVRHIVNGGSVNVLHLLGVWNNCVETVKASALTSVETCVLRWTRRLNMSILVL